MPNSPKFKKKNIFLSLLLLAMTFSLVAHAQLSTISDLENLETQNSDFVKAYNIIDTTSAWKAIIDSEASLAPVKIGISDTGIDAGHPEFAGALVGANRVGVVDLGNTTPGAKMDSEPGGHGTQVAGIIGANNLLGLGFPLSNTSPQMNGILSGVPSLQYSLEMRQSKVFDAFRWLTTINDLSDNNVKIINISMGKKRPNNFALVFFWNQLSDQFRKTLTHFSNITFVIAAGGFPEQDVENVLPANSGDLPNVVTVADTDLSDHRGFLTNFGTKIAITAPGVEVYSPAPRGKGNFPIDTKEYDQFFSGSSAAAPMVTGVAGLLKAIKPDLTPAQMKDILTRTADPLTTADADELLKTLGSGCILGTPPPGFRGCRLNALRAVCDPQVLNCDTSTAPFVLHALNTVQLFNNNESAGEIKANNFVVFGTNNVHQGNVMTSLLFSAGTDSSIIGNVGYNSLIFTPPHTPPTITGTITTPTTPPNVVLPNVPLIPEVATLLTITENTTLHPGNYGTLIVTNGATLTLQDGVYNFSNILFFNPDTSLRFSAGSIVNVNDGLLASENVHILPALAGSAARLPVTTRGHVTLTTRNTLAADILALGGVLLGSDNNSEGSIRAESIFAFEHNRINVPPSPSLARFSMVSHTYPTSTTLPLETLMWMEDYFLTTLREHNVSSTTQREVKQRFEGVRGEFEIDFKE